MAVTFSSRFVARVESAVRHGQTPRPSIRAGRNIFTPVLCPVLARPAGRLDASDTPGIALADMLGRVASGELANGQRLIRALRADPCLRVLRQDAARLFHLLYGCLQLVAYERCRGTQLIVGIGAEELLELVAGLGRGIGGRHEDLAVHVTHFLVHAAAFLEAEDEIGWADYADRVQARLAAWGEDPTPEVVLAHATHNLYLPIHGGPTDDRAYDAIRAGRRALRDGKPREEVHGEWLKQLGWRTADHLLPMLLADERRPFFRTTLDLLTAAPADEQVALASRIGMVDEAGEPMLPGRRWRGAPRLHFPGGPAIGRSCVLYDGGGARIAVDMGGDPYGRVPAWSPAFEDLDALVVTHAHQDHIGGLPYLYGELGYDGPWYAHRTTITCTELALRDSLQLRADRDTDAGEVDTAIVERIMARARDLTPGVPVQLCGIRLTGLEAGHIPGSLQFLLEVETDAGLHRTLVSGDINPGPSLSVHALQYPAETICAALDVLIVEGTNAFRDEEIVDALGGSAALRAAIEGEVRRPVLLPVMSLGRAQEVIAALAATPWKVGVFGLAARMTDAIGMPIPPNVTLETRYADQVSRDRYDVLVASAGCLQGGPSRYFWAESGWDVPVILTGYLFPGTPAHAQAASMPRIRFSGHASAQGWADYIARFPRATKYLVHFPGDRLQAARAGFVVPRADRVYAS